MASLDSGGQIEFLIPVSGDDYLDLVNTMLHIQGKVTRADRGDLDLPNPWVLGKSTATDTLQTFSTGFRWDPVRQELPQPVHLDL